MNTEIKNRLRELTDWINHVNRDVDNKLANLSVVDAKIDSVHRLVDELTIAQCVTSFCLNFTIGQTVKHLGTECVITQMPKLSGVKIIVPLVLKNSNGVLFEVDAKNIQYIELFL